MNKMVFRTNVVVFLGLGVAEAYSGVDIVYGVNVRASWIIFIACLIATVANVVNVVAIEKNGERTG